MNTRTSYRETFKSIWITASDRRFLSKSKTKMQIGWRTFVTHNNPIMLTRLRSLDETILHPRNLEFLHSRRKKKRYTTLRLKLFIKPSLCFPGICTVAFAWSSSSIIYNLPKAKESVPQGFDMIFLTIFYKPQMDRSRSQESHYNGNFPLLRLPWIILSLVQASNIHYVQYKLNFDS